MTHFVLTRKCYEQLKASFGNFPFAFWVNDGVLSASELAELRAAGFSVTNFTTVIDPNCSTEVASAVVTIQQHHPNQSGASTRSASNYSSKRTPSAPLNSGVRSAITTREGYV